jgi:hypothetical protein
MTIHAACRTCGENLELEPVQLHMAGAGGMPHRHRWANFVRKHATCPDVVIHAACRTCGENVELVPVELLTDPFASPPGHHWVPFVRKHTTCNHIPSKVEAPNAPTPAVVRPDVIAAPGPVKLAPIVPPQQPATLARAPVPPAAPAAAAPPAVPPAPAAPPAPTPPPPSGTQPPGGLLIVGPKVEPDQRE